MNPKDHYPYLILTLLLIIPMLTACSQAKQDKVTVYNANHQKVTTITKKSSLQSFSKLASKAGSTKNTQLNGKLPHNAKIKFYYVMHQAKPKITLHMFIYANTKYSKLSGLPVGKVTYRLSDNHYQKFSHPNSFN